MSLTLFIHGGPAAMITQMLDNSFETIGHESIVYSGLKLAADGLLYERQADGGWSSFGAWLLNGTNSGFYVSMVVTGGSLSTDAGAGPLVLSTDRIYDVQQVGPGSETAQLDLEISTDVSGSPVVASNTYFFDATKEDVAVRNRRITIAKD